MSPRRESKVKTRIQKYKGETVCFVTSNLSQHIVLLHIVNLS